MGVFKSFFDTVSPVKFFVVTAFIFGSLFILITPPFQTPDEPTHFLRAYQVSEGQLKTNAAYYKNTPGDYFPVSIGKTIDATSTRPIIKFLPSAKYDIYKTSRAANIEIKAEQKMFFPSDKIAQYSPLNYALQGIGMAIGKLFSVPPIALLYIARFMGLVTWVVLFACAIKLLPKRRWAAVYIGLLPMALFQAAGVGADVVTNGASALFVAYVLRLLWNKSQLTGRDLGLLIGIGSLMVLSKPIMAIFLLFVLLIPARQILKSKQRVHVAYLVKMLLVIVPVCILQVWLAINQGGSISLSDGVNGSDPGAQARFIANNPHSFINTLWNTYFFSWGDTVTRSIIGSFGWVDAPLSEGIVTIGYIGLALVLLLSTDRQFKPWLKRSQKLTVATILLLYWGAVSAAMYLYYSPIGFKIIVGLQGRYLLPMLLPLIALLQSRQLKTDPKTYVKIATITPLFLLTCSVITIYVRYYVNNV